MPAKLSGKPFTTVRIGLDDYKTLTTIAASRGMPMLDILHELLAPYTVLVGKVERESLKTIRLAKESVSHD